MKFALLFVVVFLAVLWLAVATGQARRWRRKPLLIAAGAAALIYAIVLSMAPVPWWLADIAVLGLSAAGGSVLGLLLASRASLISFCVVAAVVEVFSFAGGATAAITRSWDDGTSTLLQFLAITIPVSGAVQPVIGIGDLLVIGALCFALMRLGVGEWLAFLAPLAGALAALATALLVGGIAALPFIAMVTVATLFLVPVSE